MSFCAQILDKISKATQKVHLLPVSKGQKSQNVHKLWIDFPQLTKRLGENYLEELLEKKTALASIQVEWHFLGSLQGRKMKTLCEVSSYLHGLYRLKELELLTQQSQKPKFFIQVNISGEAQKGGLEASELPLLIEKVQELRLNTFFQGLMGVAAPPSQVGEKSVGASFLKLRKLRDLHCPNKELSMGMSQDYEIALKEGSNWLRIGSLLFGERSKF